MIRIISGVYGGKNGVKRPGDKPFSLSPAEEARLVARKVAAYVEEPAAVLNNDAPDMIPDMAPPAEPVGESIDDGTPIGFDEQPELPDGVIAIPEYSVDMKATELREIGKLCGLTFKVGMTKEDMVAALDAHIAANMVEDDDAPTFDAAEAVV